MRCAAIVINYNGDKFLEAQCSRVRKYLQLRKHDTLDYIVVDNGSRPQSTQNLKRICHEQGLIYHRYDIHTGDNSTHHALALNQIYNYYRHNFNAFLFIDHDMFPFNYSDILIRGNRVMAGLAQSKLGKQYLHPGLLYIDLDKIKIEPDFTPCPGMDTGGKLADYVTGNDNIEYLSQEYIKYGFHNDKDFYEVIDGAFMHFIKGSNWNNNKQHSSRLKALWKELHRKSVY